MFHLNRVKEMREKRRDLIQNRCRAECRHELGYTLSCRSVKGQQKSTLRATADHTNNSEFSRGGWIEGTMAKHASWKYIKKMQKIPKVKER